MTPKTDKLPDDLRAMLHDRANDVSSVPSSVFAFEQHPAVDVRPDDAVVLPLEPARRSWRHTGGSPLLAVAASVVAILAIVATVVAFQRSGGNGDPRPVPPAGSSLPTTSPPPHSSAAPKPAAHVTRSAALHWFGLTAPSGYDYGERESRPDYQTLSLTRLGDNGTIPGSNGGSPFQTIITVWGPGKLAGDGTVAGWRHVDLAGRTAYVGKLGLSGDKGYEYATLAFESPGKRWVFVQGRTAGASTDAALLKVGRAVRPDTTVDIEVGYRLSYAPSGSRVTMVYEDLTGRYASRIMLESATGTVELIEGTSVSQVGIGKSGATTQRVDGETVYLHRSTAEAVVSTGSKTAIGVRVSPPGTSAQLTDTQRTELNRILAGLTWRNRQGQSGLPAEQAIP